MPHVYYLIGSQVSFVLKKLPIVFVVAMHVNSKCILDTFDLLRFKNTDLAFAHAPLRYRLALAHDCH